MDFFMQILPVLALPFLITYLLWSVIYDPVKKVKVNTLKVGDTFSYEGHLYMLADFGNRGSALIDVVRDDGHCDCFFENTLVDV